MHYAQVPIPIGDIDPAFDALRTMAGCTSGALFSAALLGLDPAWNPLHQDARFAARVAATDNRPT